MPIFELPKESFEPHPEGQHEGTITEIEDRGMVETPYGEKHKISVKIDSDTALMANGEGFALWEWLTISNSPKSNMHKFRIQVLGRGLTKEEAASDQLNTDEEWMGKKVGYTVVHNTVADGRVFANLQAIWPRKDADETPANADAPITDAQALAIETLEGKADLDERTTSKLRGRYLKTDNLEAATQAGAVKYLKGLKDYLRDTGVEDETDDPNVDLPF